MIVLRFNDFDEMMRFAETLTGLAGNGTPTAPEPVPTPASAFTAPQPAAPWQAPMAPQPAAPWQAPMAPPAQAPVQQPPVQPVAPGIPPAPAPVPPAVPASAPSYTPDDLARAAMTLMDSGRQQELIGLLQNFGVSSLPDLRPDQYGAFATALRGMGAQI